jgi:predicted RNA-binding protein with PIN domain
VSSPRHLLVDGANVLHAWPDLRALYRRDRDSARSQLVQRLAPIHDVEDVRVTIVFDGRGDELVVERPSQQPTFSIVYTPSSLTADDVIEQTVGASAQPANCIVASDDRAERQTVAATGASAITADDLAAWIRRAEARQSAAVRTLQSDNARAWKNA